MNDVVDDIKCQSAFHQYKNTFFNKEGKIGTMVQKLMIHDLLGHCLVYVKCGPSVSIIFSNVITITTTLLL